MLELPAALSRNDRWQGHQRRWIREARLSPRAKSRANPVKSALHGSSGLVGVIHDIERVMTVRHVDDLKVGSGFCCGGDEDVDRVREIGLVRSELLS